MACNITTGRSFPSCKNIGGLKEVYFLNYTGSLETDLEFAVDGTVDGFSSKDYSLYQYELRGANSVDEINDNSFENGTTFWTAAGSLQLPSQSASSRSDLQNLAKGRPHLITKDWNGQYKLYGDINGCEVNVSTNSGTGMGDFNGYTVTISSTEDHLAYIVDSTIIDDGINTSIV